MVLGVCTLLFPDFVYHWDEVQLSLGLDRFDLRHHQPHAPGYYVFILLGRLLQPLVHGPENALRCVAALAVAGFVWLVGASLPREGLRPWARAGFAAAPAMFALCSPVVLFYAVSALNYTSEVAAWVGILLAVGRHPRGPWLWLLGAGIGLCGGVRQTLILWGLLILVVEGLRHRGWLDARAAFRLAGGLAAGTLAWLVPMLVEVGGWGEYVAASSPLLSGNIWASSVFSAGFGVLGSRVPLMLRDAWTALGPLAAIALSALVLRSSRAHRGRLARWDLLPAGAVLAFAFYAAVIYDNRGYILAVAMPLAAWTTLVLAEFAAGGAPARQVLGTLSALVPAAALLLLPGGALNDAGRGYSLLRGHDAELKARIEVLRRLFPPASTLLVTSHEYWNWSFRHVMYYLPEYTVIQLVPDRFFIDTSPERPYLMARGRHVSFGGPDGVELRQLALPAPAFRQAVYLIPHDVEQYILPSCAAWMSPLQIPPAELLPVLPLDGPATVRLSRGRIDCE